MNRQNFERLTWLGKSLFSFAKTDGKSIESRLADWRNWLAQRREHGVWPYCRIMSGHPGTVADVAKEFGSEFRQLLNFGSQDYLSLSDHPDIVDAACATCKEYGVHSAGSGVVAGRTMLLRQLEERLARVLNKEACAVFPTGWAAGFGVMAGLVRPHDTIIIDELSHNCLSVGASFATSQVNRFDHNDLESLESTLKTVRERNRSNGVFVVVESLYSMDSDSPDLSAVVELAHCYDGLVIVDVAHDFGCMGVDGLGLLESVSQENRPDIIMGSFSKTFAANGGFVAAASTAVDYLRCYAPSFTFSNALSPIQTTIVNKALDIVLSDLGHQYRAALMNNIKRLRAGMERHGLHVSGTASPIVPVFVGNEATARLTSRAIEKSGLLANLAEFPGVPVGTARFRFQLMRKHSFEQIDRACEIMAQGSELAGSELAMYAQKPVH